MSEVGKRRRSRDEVFEILLTRTQTGMFMIWPKRPAPRPGSREAPRFGIVHHSSEGAWEEFCRVTSRYGWHPEDRADYEPRLTNITYQAVRRRPKSG